MTPKELSERLSMRADAVARHLLPNGKRAGHEWQVGNLSGDKGQSLQVHLDGDKAGLWCDFSTGESGDLLDLWCGTQRCDLRQAMEDAKAWLGVKDIAPRTPAPKKSHKRPERPKCAAPKEGTVVFDYLAQRGVQAETIKRYKVAADGRNIVLPYIREGELIFVKWLGIDRDDGKKKIRASAESEPCLFGWQAIPETAREVTITEGEIDAMSAWQYGKPALSVPFGGGTGNKQQWIEYEFDNLDRFDTIYLALDQDEQGKSASHEIAMRLGQERCRIVTLPKKDFNECTDFGVQQYIIDHCYQHAKSLDPEKLRDVSDFRDDIHAEFDLPTNQAGMALPWQKAQDKIRFREAEVTIWTGWNGHGKSQCLNYIALHGMLNDHRFCIASMEMPAKRTLSRMLRQASGMAVPARNYRDAIIEFLSGRLWIYDQMGSAKLDEMMKAFRYAAKRYKVKHFVIDSLAKLGMAEDDYNGQKHAIDEITKFAQEMNVHVHLVAHPRKGADESNPPGKMDIRGGASITDMADNVITVWRNKKKELELEEAEEGEELKHKDEGDVRLIITKQRMTGEEGRIPLWFDKNSCQYMGAETHMPRQWVHYSEQDQEVAA